MSLDRLQLFRGIHAQIGFRGADIGMAEPEGDFADVACGLQHDHRAAMAQLMRGYGAAAQRLADLSCFTRMLIQYVFETGPSHRRSLRIDEEFGCADIPSHREPSPQVSGR